MTTNTTTTTTTHPPTSMFKLVQVTDVFMRARPEGLHNV
jgi:hypothetical protein